MELFRRLWIRLAAERGRQLLDAIHERCVGLLSRIWLDVGERRALGLDAVPFWELGVRAILRVDMVSIANGFLESGAGGLVFGRQRYWMVASLWLWRVFTACLRADGGRMRWVRSGIWVFRRGWKCRNCEAVR